MYIQASFKEKWYIMDLFYCLFWCFKHTHMHMNTYIYVCVKVGIELYVYLQVRQLENQI